jgi:acyl carrier protein
MDETENRLTKCFETAFPALPATSIPLCSQAIVDTWDSVTTIILVHVIEDEFGFEVDLDLLPQLDSFERILAYVRAQVQSFKE